VLDLSGRWDLDALTINDALIAVTQPSITAYPLPRDFGRFPHPVNRSQGSPLDDYGETGLRLWNGSREGSCQLIGCQHEELAGECMTASVGNPY